MIPKTYLGCFVLIDVAKTRETASSLVAFSDMCDCNGCLNFRLVRGECLQNISHNKLLPFFNLDRINETTIDLVSAVSDSEVLYSGTIDLAAIADPDGGAVIPSEADGVNLYSSGVGFSIGISQREHSKYLQLNFQCFSSWVVPGEIAFGHQQEGNAGP